MYKIMKRIIPMEIKFYGLSLHNMSEHISESAWAESLGDMLVDSDSLNFDMRIRARLNLFDKTMYRL